MIPCPECGEEFDINEDDFEYECPFCGQEDLEEGYYECPYCGELFDFYGDVWECEVCQNEGKSEEEVTMTREIEEEDSVSHCPFCGAELEEDCYCYMCGWPNNQGCE